jgi:hypothetical protein
MNLIKILVLFILLFFTGKTVLSQDIIYVIDGKSISAKVIEVNPKEVVYNDFYNPNGPVYRMRKNQILKIVYKNGSEDVFNGDIELENSIYGKNIFTYHLFDLIFGDFTFSYERISKNGKIGFKIPVSVGYGDVYSSTIKNVFYSGFGINIYPTGQGKWKYFMGPNIRVGVGRDDYYEYGCYPYYYHREYHSNIFYFKVLVDNGISYSPIKNFSISGYISIGVKYLDIPSYDYKLSSTAQFSLNLSYRF